MVKINARNVFLSLFFALAIGFSFSTEASAHQYKDYTHSPEFDINAEDINAGDMDDIEKLVLHVAKHINLIQTDPNLRVPSDRFREFTVFSKLTREQGILNNGDDIYSIRATHRGAVLSHGRYQNLYGKKYDNSVEPMQTLFSPDVPEFSDSVEPKCVPYGNENRVACAVRQGSGVIMAGFDHAEDYSGILAPDCSAFRLSTTAKDVEEEKDPKMKRDLLKQYVESFVEVVLDIIREKQDEARAEDINVATGEGQISGFFEEAPCLVSEDFKHGTVYPFVMDPQAGVSYFNGLDFDLHGLSVSLEDPDPVPYDDQGNIESNVLDAFKRVITTGNTGNVPDDLADGNSGFVTYHWAHPDNPNHPFDGYLEDGVVPGDSIKESYLQVVNILPPELGRQALLVFGSGIYPDVEDDGGCVIASVDNAPQGALLNLFLIASVLFSVVFLRKRV